MGKPTVVFTVLTEMYFCMTVINKQIYLNGMFNYCIGYIAI